MPIIAKDATMDPTINTLDGELFSFRDLDFSRLTVDGMAAALAKICRFSGHCLEFYSVAEHSVIVSHIVPKNIALLGLIHDLHESVMGDMSSPLKSTQPEYKAMEVEAERYLRNQVLAQAGVIRGGSGQEANQWYAVKKADTLVYLAEREKIMPALPAEHPEHEYIPLPLSGTSDDRAFRKAYDMIQCLEWRAARDLFLKRYEELTK